MISFALHLKGQINLLHDCSNFQVLFLFRFFKYCHRTELVLELEPEPLLFFRLQPNRAAPAGSTILLTIVNWSAHYFFFMYLSLFFLNWMFLSSSPEPAGEVRGEDDPQAELASLVLRLMTSECNSSSSSHSKNSSSK